MGGGLSDAVFEYACEGGFVSSKECRFGNEVVAVPVLRWEEAEVDELDVFARGRSNVLA